MKIFLILCLLGKNQPRIKFKNFNNFINCFFPAITATAAPQFNFPQPNFFNPPSFNQNPFQPLQSQSNNSKCSNACPQNFQLLCAKDSDYELGQEFSNECSMKHHVCENRNGREFIKVTPGGCSGLNFNFGR